MTADIRKLAEEAAENAHSLGMAQKDAPSADLAYDFMCGNVWNDGGESDPVDPLRESGMPEFRMLYRRELQALYLGVIFRGGGEVMQNWSEHRENHVRFLAYLAATAPNKPVPPSVPDQIAGDPGETGPEVTPK